METTSDLDVLKVACPSRPVFDRLGERWTGLVLLALSQGPLRFNEIRRQVEGVSQKMLTQTLRGLERDGLVTRTVYATVPVTVEYRLTALGQSLREAMEVLRTWAYTHFDEVHGARATYDSSHATKPARIG